jgi:putative transposase
LNLHRPVEGKIKTTTIRRTSAGKWFVSFTVEVEPKLLPVSKKAIGIDLGLESFATNDRGIKIPNPRFFRKEERALAQAQRRLAKTKKGSKERRFRRKAVARVHERIRNKRTNFSHQLSRHLVNKYGTIIFEDLKPSRMIHNRKLSKSISDAAWAQVIQYTTYKAEEAGRNCVLVNPAFTSQDCSRCGHREKKDLKQRTHECAECGLVLDRDHNAALNILRLGLQSLADSA